MPTALSAVRGNRSLVLELRLAEGVRELSGRIRDSAQQHEVQANRRTRVSCRRRGDSGAFTSGVSLPLRCKELISSVVWLSTQFSHSLSVTME